MKRNNIIGFLWAIGLFELMRLYDLERLGKSGFMSGLILITLGVVVLYKNERESLSLEGEL